MFLVLDHGSRRSSKQFSVSGF